MIRLIHRFRFFRAVLVIIFAMQAVSCGTILYPERRGQPAGRLDLKVVALDAVGLLAFFVPGVIAFAVDFNNGTIYLPPEEYGNASKDTATGTGWTAIHVDPKELTAEKVTTVIREKTGKSVTLNPGTYRVHRLESVDELAVDFETWSNAAIAGAPQVVQFRCQSD